MSESAKYLHLVKDYVKGNGADLGSSGEPLVPWAIQVDLPREQYHIYNTARPEALIHWRGDARDLPFRDCKLDWLNCSHLLEDFKDWKPILHEWDRVLRIGGFMIVSVPDHERFRAAVKNGQGDNKSHLRESRIGEVAGEIPHYHVYYDGFVNDSPTEYSLLYVGQKIIETP